MEKINKNILSQINLYSENWVQFENSGKKTIISTRYNSYNALVWRFYKPISKIINLNGK